MIQLGASANIVFSIKIASRMNYTLEQVFNIPLAKLIMINSALDVIDGKSVLQTQITREDKEIVKFLSEHQEEYIEIIKGEQP